MDLIELLPSVVARFREGVFAAKLCNRHSCLCFPQETNDLFFNESLLGSRGQCNRLNFRLGLTVCI